MRRRSIFGLSAALLLAACAHQATEAPPALAWSLQQNPTEGVKLTYGQPQTDNILVMMSCLPASNHVELAVAARTAGEAPVHIRSAGAVLPLDGPAWPTPMAGVGMVIAPASADQPTLARFARTGELVVEADGRAVRAPARARDDRALVADFFSVCRQQA